MEELTIEQKAKRYNEAIKIVKSKIKNDKDHVLYEEDIIEIFPELKKKTDEEIRQQLIAMCHLYYGEGDNSERDECLEWLEKQGKQNYDPCNDCEEDMLNCNNFPCIKKRAFKQGKTALETRKEEKVDNANKVEPRFKEGQYVVDIDCDKVLHISEILSKGYLFENGDYSSFDSANKEYRLWTIEDAKDGDVVCYKDEISLYKHDIKNCIKQETIFGGFVYHCCYDGKRFIIDNLYSLMEQDKIDIHPATKEQRNTLMKAMKNAGYEWDSINKELKEIAQSPIDNTDNNEPYVKVGDYITRRNCKHFHFHDGRSFAKIIEIDGSICRFDNGRWLYDYEIKPWSISDAEDGDILVSAENKPFIYNGYYNERSVGAYCGFNIINAFTIPDNLYNWTDNRDIKPATEKQCQALFNEMKLLGWVWNTEIKELNRLDKNEENNN